MGKTIYGKNGKVIARENRNGDWTVYEDKEKPKEDSGVYLTPDLMKDPDVRKALAYGLLFTALGFGLLFGVFIIFLML